MAENQEHEKPIKLLRTPEVSELLGVPIETLKYWRARGRGPKSFALTPKHVVYKESDVLAWVEEKYNEGSGD